jgi:hypothetical protein
MRERYPDGADVFSGSNKYIFEAPRAIHAGGAKLDIRLGLIPPEHFPVGRKAEKLFRARRVRAERRHEDLAAPIAIQVLNPGPP